MFEMICNLFSNKKKYSIVKLSTGYVARVSCGGTMRYLDENLYQWSCTEYAFKKCCCSTDEDATTRLNDFKALVE